jgi:hypothetical protein
MNQCSRCEGFIPEGKSGCPNCGTRLLPAWKRILGVPLALAGAGATMVTLSACYGIPCAGTKLPDGTTTGGLDNERVCTDCTQKLEDGGLIGNDPSYQTECHPMQTQDGGNDAGCDGGTDGGC